MSGAARDHAAERYCFLTTTGRVSGAPHTIEIWFAFAPGDGRTLYMLAGGGERADWVKNLRRDPAVSLRIGQDSYRAWARLTVPGTPEDAAARELLRQKYAGWREGDTLVEWARTALPVAFDLAGEG